MSRFQKLYGNLFSRNLGKGNTCSKGVEVSSLTLNDGTPYSIAIMKRTIVGEQVVDNDLDLLRSGSGFETRPKYLLLYRVVDTVSVSSYGRLRYIDILISKSKDIPVTGHGGP
jgi:hypothetical protein